LSQVLANLLNNAAKYTPAGGNIGLTVTRERDDAVFRVRDSGTGIPQEMLPRIFDLFTQVEQSLDRSQGGLGIGLTLVQRLVEMHGGSVHAASDGPGRGSEFTVRLPAVAAPGPAQESPDTFGELGGMPKRSILVVDDNVDAADSLARLLRLQGHTVRIAFDGHTALQEARSSHPNVIILDLGLPGISGYDIARKLRCENSGEDPLIIAVSGYGREEDQRRSREAGFNHHFTKPVDFATLLRAVSAVSDGSSTLQVS
jgi:CheY-like chemotaxis protein/anti-sigma regulatory factor (Ser/Thr protein kinase)